MKKKAKNIIRNYLNYSEERAVLLVEYLLENKKEEEDKLVEWLSRKIQQEAKGKPSEHDNNFDIQARGTILSLLSKGLLSRTKKKGLYKLSEEAERKLTNS